MNLRGAASITPDAYSLHGWTQLTLSALLTGHIEEDRPGDQEATRRRRATWTVPSGFATVAPPIGHVTIPGAPRLDSGGIYDLEAALLGQSALSPLAGQLVMDGLRDRIDEAFEILATTEQPRVFAHIFNPHPPFLFGQNGEPLPIQDCWPRCSMEKNSIESLNLSLESWSELMRWQIDELNHRIIAAVDQILARSPNAVIVLFSDHGLRYSEQEPEEWHRTFLAARTPGQPGLFGRSPRPDTILVHLGLRDR